MSSLVLTLAIFTGAIIALEGICWRLFRRKMDPLRFPTKGAESGSHMYWLQRIRIAAIVHTVGLAAFTWIFCIVLW